MHRNGPVGVCWIPYSLDSQKRLRSNIPYMGEHSPYTASPYSAVLDSKCQSWRQAAAVPASLWKRLQVEHMHIHFVLFECGLITSFSYFFHRWNYPRRKYARVGCVRDKVRVYCMLRTVTTCLGYL